MKNGVYVGVVGMIVGVGGDVCELVVWDVGLGVVLNVMVVI